MAPWFLKMLLITAIVAGFLMLGVIASAKRKAYQWHRRFIWSLSLPVGLVLLTAEYGARYIGWMDAASFSPYYGSWLFPFLGFHIILASLTLLLWVVMLSQAESQFGANPKPGPHSATHKKSGKLFLVGFYATIATGCLVYYLAFATV